MHGSAGLHSAMAIKRQRRLREQAKRRAAAERERRLSSSRTDSIDSAVDDHPVGGGSSRSAGGHFHSKARRTHSGQTTAPPQDHQLATSIGMLHLGVCFLVLGLFLIGSGLLPDDVVTWRNGGWWNELVATGLFVAALGIFLISLNRVMSRKEEENLTDYVERQLTRSRSGHRLEVDVETGCLTTKIHRKQIAQRKEDIDRGLLNSPTEEVVDVVTTVHSPLSKNMVVPVMLNGEITPAEKLQQQQHLEQILEEDVYERNNSSTGGTGQPADVYKAEYEIFNKETMSTTTTASLSPGTPSETRELISNGRPHYTSRQF